MNYNLRFYAALQTLRAMVADGQFGRIIHVNGSYFQDWLFHDTDYNWRLLPKEGGKLRALADIGTHWMDAASFILGDHVGEVFADLGIHHKKRQRPLGEVKTFGGKTEGGRWQSYKVETEDYASVLLHYGRGAHGTLVGVAGGGRAQEPAAPGDLRREAVGVVGLRVARTADVRPPRHGQSASAIRGAAGFSRDEVRPYMDYPAGHVEGFADSFKMQMRAIYSRIAGSKAAPLFATVEDGDTEVRLCEAILASHTDAAVAEGGATEEGLTRSMQLGFVTAILHDLPFDEVLAFAGGEGFAVVEPMCWPVGRAERKYAGVTHIDVTDLSRGSRRRHQGRRSTRAGVGLSALGYYPNVLSDDATHAGTGTRPPASRDRRGAAAGRLARSRPSSAPTIARIPTTTSPRFLEVWPDLVRLAEQHDVRIAIENCPMLFTRDEWPSGKNLAYSPAVWRKMFDATPVGALRAELRPVAHDLAVHGPHRADRGVQGPAVPHPRQGHGHQPREAERVGDSRRRAGRRR